ncbi:MAG: CopD family protein, partial [Burkholderiales bacterium]
GMFFAHHCLRPVVAEQLQPPQRLPLMAAVLGRFFGFVALALALIWASGLGMMTGVGFARAPVAWHLMLLIGLLMTIVYALIVGRHYRRLRTAVAAQDWPAGGEALGAIRRLVGVNLGLGFLVIVLATLGR